MDTGRKQGGRRIQEEIGDRTSGCRASFFAVTRMKDYPDLVPFVSVIVSDPEEEEETVIDEALISAGYIEFEGGKEVVSLEWAWAFDRARVDGGRGQYS